MQRLLATLSALKVKVEEKDGQLHVNAPSGVLTPELREDIGRHKEALIKKLRASRLGEAGGELPRLVPDPASRHEPFPLNDVQHAYWVGRNDQIELGAVSSHVYFEFDCEHLDPERLAGSFRRLVALHDMLRAVVEVDGRQRILEEVPDFEITVYDLLGAAPDRREDELARVRAELARQVFASDRWPLFDIRLIQVTDHHSRLCVSWDFLVIDAWSMSIIFRQWHDLYRDPEHAVAPRALSFRDYVLAEARLKELPAYRASKKYWWDRIDGLPSAPLLPVVGPIEKGRRHEFTRRRFRLPAPRWAELRARAVKVGLTPSSVLLAAFAEVLHRWSKTPHYCLNLTLFNRLPLHEEVGELVGDFTNLMVLEVDGREGDRFVDRALRLQERFLDDFEQRQVSAVEVLRELAKRRGWQNRAILPVVFTSTLMLDGRRNADAGGWERFGPLGYGITQTPQVFLDHQVFEVHGDLIVNWDSVDSVFFPGVLDAMFEAQRGLLEALAVASEPWERDEVVALPEDQLETRRAANATAAAEIDGCLHEGFVARALEEPGRIAVIQGEREVEYGELLAHAALMARRLGERGVEPNQLVAVVMRRGWEQVVAVLGVLLSGAAYLPIEPRWPTLRRNQLLERAEVRIALTTGALDRELEWLDGVERLRVASERGLPPLTAAPPVRQSRDDLAYVIFTSGSTGTPKGVMIDHRAAVNTVAHVNRLFEVGPEDRVLAVSDLTFDLSVYDIFGLLAAGGTVVMPEADLARDPGHWEDQLRRRGVTLWNSAPPLMGVLVDALEAKAAPDLSPLRLVLLSGDWIPVRLPDRIGRLAGGARVVSLGGATEGAIWSIYYPVERVDPSWDSIPYGKALPNQHMYVLNRRLQPCPDWVTGDVYIGGRGVALGYWKDPERTAEQFLRHPATDERLYLTGDKGRLLPDGNIEFLGREDLQVKLRGIRVELGEITACLQSHPDVREAVVQVMTENGRSSLTGYVVTGPAEESRLFERVEVEEPRLRLLSAAVAEAGATQTREIDSEWLETFASFWHGVQEACLRSMLEAVDELGLVGVADASERLDEMVAQGPVRPAFRRLVQHWLGVLVDGGHLRESGGCYQAVGSLVAEADRTEEQLRGLERRFGKAERLSAFLEHVAESLRNRLSLLSGERNPLEVLFPEGAWNRAEAFYQTNPITCHHNRVISAVVRSLVASWEPDRPLRVLEIGAGTGGSSGAVLAELPPERTEYWFTDLSTYYFAGVKAKLSAYPFIRYAIFDAEKPPLEQGHSPHCFDLIVAANVLHSTTNIDACLAHVRELLRPAGHVVLLEGTRTSPWQWATVGYLETVHAYADERAESDVPILTVEGWSRALARSGFEETEVFPPPGVAEGEELARLLDSMPQHVFVARGPSRVRRFRSEELEAYARECLPDYMVPRRYVVLESFPLTANGKVDLKALPRAVATPGAEERRLIPPRSDVEEQILEIWREVLGVDQLGITESFFEVGGDSLLLTAVLRKINRWRRQPLTIADLFAYPTVQSLAELLSEGEAPRMERRTARSGRAAAADHDIAVIGMAGRFPDAGDPDQLWKNLAAGTCSIRRFTDDELLAAGVSPDDLAKENYVKAGSVLDGLELFDASYFGVSPRETDIMDPQQRFLLECAVEALENAGYPTEEHSGAIGVFVGKGTSFYLLDHVLAWPDIIQAMGMMPVLNVNEKDHAATLLSYKLNLTGPSVNVNTACSTGLVAVHAAYRSLVAGECDLALAGAVSIVSTLARSGYLYHEGQITSADGLCRAFSDDANGTVFGSGVGLVVLKLLAAALEDRDTIHAVIRGSAINNDGALKVGYSAPSRQGQADVLIRAYEQAGVAVETIGLLEAHGTGTRLGDPIEFGALRQVFGGARKDGSRCALGSIKPNIGHLDSAAGVAGMIKAIQALKHGKVPPTLHVDVPNRGIELDDSPFVLNTELIDWPTSQGPRRAGVSSFGVGGTNAHVVLEEAPASPSYAPDPGPYLLPLSAKNERSLRRGAERLAEALGRPRGVALGDVAFTLQLGREAHAWRSCLVCDDLDEARSSLGASDRLAVVRRDDGPSASVAFLFPGQGVQRRRVTHELYETSSTFRSTLDECAEMVLRFTGSDIRDWLYGDFGDGAEGVRESGDAAVDIHQTEFAQPLLFSVEYALARFWESLGVRPTALLGHSLGEYVAACLAQVFSLEEALSLVVVRGRLLQSVEPGRMMAVSCGEADLEAYEVDPGCGLAAVNGPTQCVLSGRGEPLEALGRRLGDAGIATRILRASHPFHSPLVAPVLETFEACVAEVERRAPQIPFLSNVTGTWITSEEAMSPSYWARHMRETVRFGAGLTELAQKRGLVLLEVGPGHVLSTLARGSGVERERVVPTFGFTASPRRERRTVLESLGQLWLRGIDVDWTPLHESREPRRVPLPTYAFERKRYWLERRGTVPRSAAERVSGPSMEPIHAAAEEPARPAAHVRPELSTPYVSPSNEIEENLVLIWQRFLGIEGIGTRDNFFELGGDSLIATRLHAQIHAELGVELPMGKMYELATVRRIYLFIVMTRDPEAAETLSEDELDDFLAVMES